MDENDHEYREINCSTNGIFFRWTPFQPRSATVVINQATARVSHE